MSGGLLQLHCQQPLLLVGAGTVGARRLPYLLQAGFQVTLIDPRPLSVLAVDGERLQAFVQREAQLSDLQGFTWLVTASDDAVFNDQVAQQMLAQGGMVNNASNTALSNFSFPAVVDKGAFRFSLSAQGMSPGVLKSLKERLTVLIPHSLSVVLRLVKELRPEVRASLPASERALFWQRALGSRVSEYFYLHRPDVARRVLKQWLQQQKVPQTGELYLIGAGPGDPELLTLRAVRLLQQADVILYDRLISDEILRMGRADAERVYVGKRKDEHEVPQQDLNQLILSLCRQGKRVARLKGGDPYVFGRGGEELALIAEAGIDFQVVPGVTAASGAACYAGIPLTHRDHAWSVRFVTGHRKPGASLNWHAMVEPGQTLVFYMGLQQLPEIVAGLLAAGMDADTPVALISDATTVRQKLLSADLQTVVAEQARRQLPSPSIIIVGSVVSLSPTLGWFDALLAETGVSCD